MRLSCENTHSCILCFRSLRRAALALPAGADGVLGGEAGGRAPVQTWGPASQVCSSIVRLIPPAYQGPSALISFPWQAGLQ